MKNIIGNLLLASTLCAGAAQVSASVIHVYEDNFSAGVSITSIIDDTTNHYSDGYNDKGFFGHNRSYILHSSKDAQASHYSDGGFIHASVNTDDAPHEEAYTAGESLNSEVYVSWDTTFSVQGDTDFSYTMSTFGNTYNSSSTHEDWWSVELLNISTQEIVFDSSDLYQNGFSSYVDSTLFDDNEYSLSVRLYGYGDTHDDHPFFSTDFYGADYTSTTVVDQTVSVPEPSVIGLMLLGMAGIFARRKYQK